MILRLSLLLIAVGIVLAVVGVPYSGVLVVLGAVAFLFWLILGTYNGRWLR